MNLTIRPYTSADLPQLIAIWNEVVEDGVAFPQEDYLTAETGPPFFAAQTHTAVAADGDSGAPLGFYILHPNNVGRCGHIANASYAVGRGQRGLHIGAQLVADSLAQGKACGFRILQFNAVVASNVHAQHLYARLGFQKAGAVPQGFRMKDGSYEDIFIYYHAL